MTIIEAARRRHALLVGLVCLFLSLPLTSSTLFAEQVPTSEEHAASAKEQSTVWVVLREEANLEHAGQINHWRSRGRFVVQQLQSTASSSQSSIQSLLDARRATYRSFWIANTIKVTADDATIKAIAARPEVAEIIPDGIVQIPEPMPGQAQVQQAGIEWGIANIRAYDVWNEFGVRGEGIVIANIDTGVQFDHPALVRQYRGNTGNGTFDHNYNWFDPSRVCGFPSLIPCDNDSHGTHTMGTMVGDDGGGNQIGVAPAARWIAAKGCESSSCTFEALLAAGEWILAPTDLNGNAPRPELRPTIVNNSWSSLPGDPFYEHIVGAWVAAGIFPVFANGNFGPDCGSASSPGDYPQSYAAGAHDRDNQVAWFSGRGSVEGTSGFKPNISAPGVNIRSSIPGDDYTSFGGTSMAAPHVAGTVALLWSAAPSLVGDIASTRALLDEAAIDTSDLTCGGSSENNNVYGEGRLDAHAAVALSPRGSVGTLSGAVTSTASGSPVAGATVQITGPATRILTTSGAGTYHLRLAAGEYQVSVSTFGYQSQSAVVHIGENSSTSQDFALVVAPVHSVSGYVYDSSSLPLAGATVTIERTPLAPAITNSAGFYHIAAVPEGDYWIRGSAGSCLAHDTAPLEVDGDEALNFVLHNRTDRYGYTCHEHPASYIGGDTLLPLTGDDEAMAAALPFSFPFYGESYQAAYVSTNGFLNFQALSSVFTNRPLPDPGSPNAAIYPYWDDLNVDDAAAVLTAIRGEEPFRQVIFEWRNVSYYSDSSRRIDFEIILQEDGSILTQYRDIDDDLRERGSSATIGIENALGQVSLQYGYNQPLLPPSSHAVRYVPPVLRTVAGIVTDHSTGYPIEGAEIAIPELGIGTSTGVGGHYVLQVPVGTFTLQASAHGYGSAQAPITLAATETIEQNFSLVPWGTVSGTITDLVDGSPIPNALISVPPHSTQSDQNGRYTLALPNGNHTLQVGADGFERAQAQVAIADGQSHSRDFALTPLGAVNGVVVDSVTGAPVPGVWLHSPGQEYEDTTDNEGRYHLPLPAGTHLLVAQRHGYYGASTEVNIAIRQSTIQNFTLNPWGRVEGAVVDTVTGTPIAGAVVTTVPGGYGEARSNAHGRFVFPLPAGNYMLDAGATYYDSTLLQVTVADAEATPVSISLDPWGRVEGAVLNAVTGTPLSHAWVNSWNGYGTETDQNGNYVLLLPKGPDIVEALAHNYASHTVDVQIQMGQTLPLDFSLRPFGYTQGVVTDSVTGAPVPYALVYAQDAGWSGGAMTDEDGYYHMAAPAGTNNLQASAWGYSDRSVSIIVRPNRTTTRNFLLRPYGWVEGVVSNQYDRLPVTGARVTVLETGHTATVDNSGFYSFWLPQGKYTLVASAARYPDRQTLVNIIPGGSRTRNIKLQAPRSVVPRTSIELTRAQGQRATRQINLWNKGHVELYFSVGEMPVATTTVGGAEQEPASSTIRPRGYGATRVARAGAGGTVLVFMDALPWGSDALLQVLAANDISYTVANSSDMFTTSLSAYELVMIAGDQTQIFYDSFSANLSRFENFVSAGGFLWIGATAGGWNGGGYESKELPGGATVHQRFEELNQIAAHSHPVMAGLTNPFLGYAASHAVFRNLAPGTTVIATGQSSGEATLIDYGLGGGRVLAFAQPLEHAWRWGWEMSAILENAIPYAYAFQAELPDVPWLSVSPTNDLVAPGDARPLVLTVETSSLAPGLHRAQVVIRTSDPRTPTQIVAVELTVTPPR